MALLCPAPILGQPEEVSPGWRFRVALLWLSAGCGVREPPLKLMLDLEPPARTAVLRQQTEDEVTIAALDLESGAGAEALVIRDYLDTPISYSAFTYSIEPVRLGLLPGALAPVEKGQPLPTPLARWDRSVRPLDLGHWAAHPAADTALDSFLTDVHLACTPWSAQAINLRAPLAVFQRTLARLSGDRVVVANPDGTLFVVQLGDSPQITLLNPRRNSSLKAMATGSDDRIWLSYGSGTSTELWVGTATGGFQLLPPRTPETLMGDALYALNVDAGDPQIVYGMTDFSALLIYDGHSGRWTKRLVGPRADKLYCKTVIGTDANGDNIYDEVPTNYFCGGVLSDADGPVVFDLSGRAPPQRLGAGNTEELPLIDDPPGALVTAVAKTDLGLTVVRGNTTESSVQFLSHGHWELLRPSFKTLRIFSLGSIDEHRVILGGASGSLTELIDGRPCDDRIMSLTSDALGKLTVTDHYVVYSVGENVSAQVHTIYASRIP
ncbi:MAG: hypothetical protein U1E65_27715 [Myxococcota bacterium]